MNQNLFKDWCLPSGKTHADFFNPSKMSLRPNTQSWPQFPHHETRVLTAMCLKFQTTGRCKTGCFYSHVNPQKDVDRPKRDEITLRLQGIYNS